MRASQFLLGVAATVATVACVASGCGGSTNSGGPSDSGAADVTMDHNEAAAEAAPEAAPEAASDACPSDAQITSIPIPDGSVPGSDASAAVCLGCVETACPNLVAECNAICGCPQAFDMFEACVASGGSVITCGETDLLSSGLPTGDVTCAAACLNTCGFSLDAGSHEGGEGGGEGGDASGE